MRFILTNDDGIDAPALRPGKCGPASRRRDRRRAGRRPFRLQPPRHDERPHPRAAGRAESHRRRGDAGGLRPRGPAPLRPGTGWVLSGVNDGGNLGADVHHSGTVAAVREAVLHGWTGIAFSQYKRKGLPIDWAEAAARLLPVLRDLTARPVEPGVFWSVNLPHLEPGSPTPESVFCPLDTSPLPLSFRQEGEHLHYDGDYHGRRRTAGADVEVCFGGRIAMTQLRLA